MTLFAKFLLFFTSWSPAYALIVLIAWKANNDVAMISLLFTSLSAAIYFAMEYWTFSKSDRIIKVKSISRRDENILMYVIAYLPPFFSVQFDHTEQIFALLWFYIIFAFSYVSLGLFYLNPMFIMRGYRTFTVIAESGEEYIALIKGNEHPRSGQTIHYRNLERVLLVESFTHDGE